MNSHFLKSFAWTIHAMEWSSITRRDALSRDMDRINVPEGEIHIAVQRVIFNLLPMACIDAITPDSSSNYMIDKFLEHAEEEKDWLAIDAALSARAAMQISSACGPDRPATGRALGNFVIAVDGAINESLSDGKSDVAAEVAVKAIGLELKQDDHN